MAKSLKETVIRQLAENNPPEAKYTLERLLKNGLSKERAIAMLTTALTYEMYLMLKEERTYHPDNYIQQLNSL